MVESFKIRFPVSGLVAILLAGCCTARHCENAGQAVARYHFQPASVEEALGARAEGSGKKLDVLILSGGGSHGAWGAGVLRGWRENRENPRPARFQVVTGISTGALLATYAFLGELEDDDLLERAYTTVQTSDIYRKRFLPFVLFSDSLWRSSPLWRTVTKYVSQETLDRVARAGRDEHRRLYVGTVNLDTGRLVVWDMTEVAMDDSNPNRLDLYRRIVFAAASIPIMVPPVKIDGNLYADGGARAQLFFEKGFFPGLRQAKQFHEDRRTPPPELTLHIIVNGKLGLDPACVRDCLKDVTMRTLDMLLDANEFGDLYRIKYVLETIRFGHFRLCYIPAKVEITTSEVFDPQMMRKLYDAGVQFGKTAAKWDDRIPDPDMIRR